MSNRLTRTVLATAVCLLLAAPTVFAGSGVSKTGKSGQVYTWSAGHC